MTNTILHNNPSRWHLGLVAAFIHRLSGLAIAVFLPLHFLSLGLAFEAEVFGEFIEWASNPLVKISEFALVTALALHFTGGVRILVMEFWRYSQAQSYLIAFAFSASLAIGLLFLLSAFG